MASSPLLPGAEERFGIEPPADAPQPAPIPNEQGFASQLLEEENAVLEQTLRVGAKFSPELFTDAEKVARARGTAPQDELLSPELKLQAQILRKRELIEANPSLRTLYVQGSVGEQLKVSDLERANGIGRHVGNAVQELRRGFSRGELDIMSFQQWNGTRAADDPEAKALEERLAAIPDPLDETITDQMIGGAWGIMPDILRSVGAGLVGGAIGAGVGAGAGAIAGGVGAGPGALIGAGAGFTGGMAAHSFAGLTGATYRDIKKIRDPITGAPIPDDIAKSVSGVAGVLAASLDVVSMGALTGPAKRMAQEALAKRMLTSALQNQATRSVVVDAMRASGIAYGAEVTTEAAQAVIDAIAQEYAKAEANKRDQGYRQARTGAQILGEGLEAGQQAAISMPFIAGLGAGVPAAMRARQNQVAAQHNLNVVNAILEEAGQLEVKTRNPAAADAVVEAVTAGTIAKEVSIPVDRLAQVMEETGITGADLEMRVPGITQQIVEARESGADVSIPTAAYVNHIAPSGDFGNRIREHTRFSPGLETEAEIRENIESYARDDAATQELSARRTEVENTRARLVADVMAELREQGGMTPERARQNAAIVAAAIVTESQRSGKPVEVIAARYPRVARRFVTGRIQELEAEAAQLAQQAVQPVLPETVPVRFGDAEFQMPTAMAQQLGIPVEPVIPEVPTSQASDFAQEGSLAVGGSDVPADPAMAVAGEATPVSVDPGDAATQRLYQRAPRREELERAEIATKEVVADLPPGTERNVDHVDELVRDERLKRLTLRDLIGMKIFPTIADRTAAGAVYRGIDSSRLEVAVPLLGGPYFPLRLSNWLAGVGWANRGKSVTQQKAGKLKAGATHMLVLMGDANMHQSNTTVTNAFIATVEAYVRDGRIPPENIAKLDEMIRSANVQTEHRKDALRVWPGLLSPEAHTFTDKLSFEARKTIVQVLSQTEAADLGAPNFERILDATREPDTAGLRWGDGAIVIEVDQENPGVMLGEEGTEVHPDYPFGVRGKVVGILETPVNWRTLWRDYIAEKEAENAARGAGNEGIRYGFQLGKPIVEVTEDLVNRIGDIRAPNLNSAGAARLAADMVRGDWRGPETSVKQGGLSPAGFLHAARRAGVPAPDLPTLKAGIKAGTIRLRQLGTSQVFLGMERRDTGWHITHLINNEQGMDGVAIPALALRALEEGATTAERRVSLAAYGFTVDATSTMMVWTGDDNARAGITGRYLAGGPADLFPGSMDPDAIAAASGGLGGDLDGAVAGADGNVAGADAGAGGGVAPEPVLSARGLASLTDAGLENYGLTAADRDAARRALGVETLYQRGRPAQLLRSIDELVRSAEEQGSWRDWYERHEDILILLFGEEHTLFQQLLSATSQATGVKGNVTLALKAFEQLKAGLPFEGFLPAVIKNLERIRNDEALEGAKISQYGKANQGDLSAIAVDRHIAMLMFDVKTPSRAQIQLAKETIRDIAVRLGWEPRQVQAALWAANQVRLGTDPSKVQSYDTILLDRAEAIDALLARFQPEGPDAAGAGRGDAAGGDAPAGDLLLQLEDEIRGSISFGVGDRPLIELFKAENASTFQHELGHFLLRNLKENAGRNGQSAADWAAIRVWLGVEGDTLTTEQEEKFARGWEAYLYEGRAPSGALQDVFTRFASWLRMVYVEIARLNVELTPDVRRVMDRLLATDEEIEAQDALVEWRPLDRSAFQGDEIQYARYIDQVQAARDAARNRLREKLMREITREHKREWREQLKALIETTTEELQAMPVHNLRKLLIDGEDYDGVGSVSGLRYVLSFDAIAEAHGGEIAEQLRSQGVAANTSTNREVISPDLLAELIDFNGTGRDLVMGLANTPPIKEHARMIAESRMRSEAGDLLADHDARMDEAEASMHSDERGDLLEQEHQVLSAQAGITAPSPRRLAKAVAEEAVRPLPVRQLDPRKYQAAERRAARKAEDAVFRRDFAAAAGYKRQQLQAHEMALAHMRAQEEVESAVRHMRRMAKRPPGVDFAYMDQIDKLLARFNIKELSDRQVMSNLTLMDYLLELERNNQVTSINEKLRDDAFRAHYTELPLEDLRALRDAVKQLEYTGREAKRVSDGEKRVELEDLAEQLEDRAAKISNRKVKDPRFRHGMWDRVSETMHSMATSLLRVEQLVDWLDGGPEGPWRKYVWERISRAQVAEQDMQKRYAARVQSIFENAPKGYLDEKIMIPALGVALRRSQIYMYALNTGNASNREKMLRGEAKSPEHGVYTEERLAAVLAQLTAEDGARIQKIWDTLESLWPDVAALSKRLTGLEPPKIQPTPVVIGGVQFKGGYFPLAYEAELATSEFADREKEYETLTADSTHIKASISHGHRLTRTEYASPVMLDINLVASHLGKVIHDVTHWEAYNDVWRIVTHPRVDAVLRQTMGMDIRNGMRQWLNRIANERTVQTPGLKGWTGAIQFARQRIGVVAMGWRLSTALTQFVGFSNSMEHVSPIHLAAALARYSRHPFALHDEIAAKSGEMRHRFNTMERDIREAMRAAIGQKGLVHDVQRTAYYAIGAADRIVAEVTWLGAFQQAKADGKDDPAAISLADRAVRLSQGAGGMKDMSQLQAEKGMWSLATMFYSYFNLYFNRLWNTSREVRRLFSSEGNWADAPHIAARVLAHTIIPAVLADIITGKGPDEDEEDEKGWLAANSQWAARKILLYPFASVPIIRDLTRDLDWSMEKGGSWKVELKSPLARPLDLLVGVPKTLVDAYVNDEDIDGRRTAKRALDLTGYVLGLPTGQIATTGDAIWQHFEGEDVKYHEFAFGKKPDR